MDVITPIVDDPFVYGEIAASNALSDVYAMGAEALFSLSFLGVPRDFPGEAAAEIARGGASLAQASGAPVVPIHIQGLYEVFPVDATWPRPGPVRLRFGSPVAIHETEDFREAAQRIEEEVRRLGAR